MVSLELDSSVFLNDGFGQRNYTYVETTIVFPLNYNKNISYKKLGLTPMGNQWFIIVLDKIHFNEKAIYYFLQFTIGLVPLLL